MNWIAQRRGHRQAVAVMVVLLAAQSWGLIQMHPLGLSYYNALVGGPAGAAAVGFEATYWGDSVTRTLLDEVAAKLAEGSTLHVAPVLHPFQLEELFAQSPALREREIRLRPYDDTTGEVIRTVLVIRRHADSWASLTPEPKGRQLFEVVRGGVQLAAVYDLTPVDEGR
jgi:hypothetical protein